MSIIRIPFPNDAPVDITDWEENIDVTQFNSYGVNDPVNYNFDSDTVKQGVRIMIGGVIYFVSNDEAITGTPSDYVKITPAGSSASAAYVADLTDVSWNSAYNFYEDLSGNSYLFNEAKAFQLGDITEPKTTVGKALTAAYISMEGQIKFKYYYKSDASPTEDELLTELLTWLTVDGDYMSFTNGQAINGQIASIGAMITGAWRQASNVITLGWIQSNGVTGLLQLNSGSGTVVATSIEIMSNSDPIN